MQWEHLGIQIKHDIQYIFSLAKLKKGFFT